MEYLQINFYDTSQEQNEILIAQLNDIGFDGFEEEDNSLKAYISISKFDENLFNNIIDINQIKYSKSIIKEQNWNEKWEADFEPVEVSHPTTSKPFVYIRAGFHKPNILFEYNIEVTPKMSFGTGHHATTFLMVQQMSQIDFIGKTVIDFGTGTGVLAILAEKMGAKSILAIDCDDWSINNAKENIEVNGCININLLKAETIPAGNTADIILANINLNIISANIAAIKLAAKAGAPILFSGIMLHDEVQILQVLSNAPFQVKNIFKKDNWLAILCVNG
jgi:ribosomal protein L11 methyltransferase